MSEEASALSTIHPPPAAQGAYESICAALMQTERGRWFLEEYARRNRSADTQLLLAAIGRIEAVVCAERNRQSQQGFRSDLLEMAKAITRTRAEVAEIGADAATDAESVPSESEAAAERPQSRPSDVFAAAERIRDVTWAMRGHGFDPSTCEQLEQLAASILSASALRDPTDHRASKLSEVLQYLEHRIESLLESSADGDAPAPADDGAAADGDDFASAPTTPETAPESARANALAADDCEPDPTASRAAEEAPDLPQDALQGDSPMAHDDLEGDTPAQGTFQGTFQETFQDARQAPVAHIPSQEELPPLPERSDDPAFEPPPEQSISARDHELAEQTADQARGLVEDSMESFADGAEAAPPVSAEPTAPPLPGGLAEPAADAGPAAVTTDGGPPPSIDGDAPMTFAEPKQAFQHAPQAPLLPVVAWPDAGQLMLKAAAAHAASTASREAARTLLPEIDLTPEMRGLNAARTRGLLGAAPALSVVRPAQPAPPPLPQSPIDDPLAALKAMSDDELIALFS